MRLLIPALLLVVSCAHAQESDFLENRWVAILSVYDSFSAAKADAEKIAAKSDVPFSMEGRVFDKKRGLIYPDNFDDEVFAGQYVSRRYNETAIKDRDTEYLSVERSDGYDGFKPGYYIVVAGIYESAKDAQAQVKRFTAWAPTAYAKKTKIYMGCMH
ncbi:MAG: hypothetical protein ACOYMS_07965 [Terrimicrobiaceae bacterium]